MKGENKWPCFPFLNREGCLCKVGLIQNILVWAGSITRDCSENREKEGKTKQNTEAIVIPTNGRPNIAGYLIYGEVVYSSGLIVARGSRIQSTFMSVRLAGVRKCLN